jgi:hypothetical protein
MMEFLTKSKRTAIRIACLYDFDEARFSGIGFGRERIGDQSVRGLRWHPGKELDNDRRVSART